MFLPKKSVLLLLFASLLAFFSAPVPVRAATDSLKVLFIGNSITYFNDMPLMFRGISLDRGRDVSVSMYAPGGTGFVHHYVDPNVYALFRNQVWDIVVLQPGSGESAGASWPVDSTAARGHILLDSLYTYSPCARVFLYEIPYGVPADTLYSTYFSVQTRIRDSVTKLADSLHLPLIPAGECFRAYYAQHPNLLLHGAYNDIHPNANGSFLVAAACYAGIFQDSASGCTFHATVDPDTAARFFSIADTVVLNHLPDWRINTYHLHAAFSYSTAGNVVSFTCLASQFTHVHWDFGDNDTAATVNPSHTYAQPGTYTVTLYAWSGTCVDSLTQEITVLPMVGNAAAQAAGITASPNPVQSLLYIRQAAAEDLRYRLYGVSGAVLREGSLNGPETAVDLSQVAAGTYFLYICTADGALRHTQRICKD